MKWAHGVGASHGVVQVQYDSASYWCAVLVKTAMHLSDLVQPYDVWVV